MGGQGAGGVVGHRVRGKYWGDEERLVLWSFIISASRTAVFVVGKHSTM